LALACTLAGAGVKSLGSTCFFKRAGHARRTVR
jgi:hypothetical protein